MSHRRPNPSHLSATLLALSVAVSLGAAGGGAAIAPAALGVVEAPASQATLMQRLTAAARSLMGRREAQAHRRAVKHRPALRAATDRAVPAGHHDPLAPPRDRLAEHLLNLPPPARA